VQEALWSGRHTDEAAREGSPCPDGFSAEVTGLRKEIFLKML